MLCEAFLRLKNGNVSIRRKSTCLLMKSLEEKTMQFNAQEIGISSTKPKYSKTMWSGTSVTLSI